MSFPPRLALAAAFALALVAAPSPIQAQEVGVPEGPDAIAEQLERKLDAGISRALAPAQALYRQALTALQAGNSLEAVRLFEASASFDPDFPDPHFTLARVVAFQNPGRAAAEFSQALRIVGRNYTWQRHCLANVITAFLVVWFLSLLLAIAGITLRHIPDLTHILQEILGPGRDAGVRLAAGAMALAPLLWGLGAIPAATVYAGLVSFRLGRREAFIVALFLVSSLALIFGAKLLTPWAGGLSLDEPSLLIERGLHSGSDAEIMGTLESMGSRDPAEPLYPFTVGTMARREGDLDRAERQLIQAAALRPNAAWILTNLGNVYFAREDYERARRAYEGAVRASPKSVEPHFNLAQTYTKQLLFAEASREQSIASALAFDRVRDFSEINTPQLNRSVMEAGAPLKALWELAQRTAGDPASAPAVENAYFSFVERMAPPAPFGLVFLGSLFLIFAGLGQILGRTLAILHCSNCQKVICRRCVHRMQQRAFCDECYAAVKDLKSMEFARLLLTGRDRRAARRRTLWETVMTFVLPGAGQMLRGASLSGFFAILVMVAAALLVVSNGALVPALDVLPVPSSGWAKRIPLLLLFVLTYAITVARYYSKTTTKVPNLAAGVSRAGARNASSRARAESGQG